MLAAKFAVGRQPVSGFVRSVEDRLLELAMQRAVERHPCGLISNIERLHALSVLSVRGENANPRFEWHVHGTAHAPKGTQRATTGVCAKPYGASRRTVLPPEAGRRQPRVR